MNPTHKEWMESVAARKGERAAEHRPQIEMLAQAEVRAAHLTGDPTWDVFLSYIQAAVETTEAQRASFEAVITDPRTVEHERMLVAKIGLAECQARIDAWEAAISLPKDIIKMGREARTLLERLPEAPDAAA